MIRTLVTDVLRYGDYSRLGESIYDHPFQWGSKRNGPDLARVGGKYSNLWHLRHLDDPRSTSAGSNMPRFHWLLTDPLKLDTLARKIAVQRTLGVPYPPMTDAQVVAAALAQAREVADNLRADGASVAPDREVVAMIAYLQKLGKYEPVAQRAASSGPRLND
jgi:cytochrome c oxidase cbb3-type subunit I/II